MLQSKQSPYYLPAMKILNMVLWYTSILSVRVACGHHTAKHIDTSAFLLPPNLQAYPHPWNNTVYQRTTSWPRCREYETYLLSLHPPTKYPKHTRENQFPANHPKKLYVNQKAYLPHNTKRIISKASLLQFKVKKSWYISHNHPYSSFKLIENNQIWSHWFCVNI